MNYLVQTHRLRLREMNLSDPAFVVELVNSEGWLKYIGDRNIKTNEQAADYLKNGPISSYSLNGFGLWLVERNDDGMAIGMCGILKRTGLEHPDIGFALLPQFTGKGYASEAASATLEFAKTHLNLNTIEAITVPENTRSITLLEKIGMHLVGPILIPGNDKELWLYST